MLGYTQQNNDVYIFFENDEIEKLAQGKIQGIYFNLKDPSKICSLEATINNEISEPMKTSAIKNEEGFFAWFLLEIKESIYQRLKDKKSIELHEGFRHICLKDVKDLNNFDKMNYHQLKYYEKQFTYEKKTS